MVWKAKVSKRKVLLYQLAVKVHGIKENVFGSSAAMYPTPTQDSVSERTKKYKQGGMPLPLAVKMFPTPTTFDQYEFKNPRKKSSGGQKPPLTQVVHMMYPTPTQDSASERTKKYKQGGMPLTTFMNKGEKTGGKLNPNFVEFLMGYPQQWTKIEPTELKVLETQSFHKSQKKSD